MSKMAGMYLLRHKRTAGFTRTYDQRVRSVDCWTSPLVSRKASQISSIYITPQPLYFRGYHTDAAEYTSHDSEFTRLFTILYQIDWRICLTISETTARSWVEPNIQHIAENRESDWLTSSNDQGTNANPSWSVSFPAKIRNKYNNQ